MELQQNDFWQTQARGTNSDEYEIYLVCADDGKGNDFTTGEPLKSYEEWMDSQGTPLTYCKIIQLYVKKCFTR